MELRQSIFVLGTIGAAQTLTSAYTGSVSNPFRIESNYQVVLDVAYTMGTAETANSVDLIVEFANTISSPIEMSDIATTDWHRQIAESTTTGVTTVTLQSYNFVSTQTAGTYDRFEIPVPVAAKYMRISAKENGVAANAGNIIVKATVTEDHS